jgi:hypothetical protein
VEFFITRYAAVVRREIDRFGQQLLCSMLCRARRGVTLELSPTPGAASTMLENVHSLEGELQRDTP